MLTLFESYLEKQSVENEEVYDRVRQGAVVFMGTLARHMESDTPKVALHSYSWESACYEILPSDRETISDLDSCRQV